MALRRLALSSGLVLAFLIVPGRAAQPQAHTATPPAPKGPEAPGDPASASIDIVSSADEERALLNRYCVPCHNEKAKRASAPSAEASRKLTLDQYDVSHVR